MIAGTFFNAGLIEAWGQGTINIVNACKEHNLPEPNFREAFGGFELTMLKDIYTEEYMRGLGLNERQIKAVQYVKEKGKITNKEYQKVTGIKERYATIELNDIVYRGILKKFGTTGRGTYYAAVKAQKAH